MSNIKFKDLAKRGTAFALVVGLLSAIGIAAFPSLSYADALNPLTERTLLLSSSSPGHHYTDAAGNTTYAKPGSGPNGKQSGEQFSFKVSTDSSGAGPDIKGFTLQYCTTAAGTCTAPGNNVGAVGSRPDTTTTADLNVNYPTPVELVGSVPGADAEGDPLVNPNNSAGNFVVISNGSKTTGWTMEAETVESSAVTGKNNFIRLYNSTGIAPAAGQQIKIIFYATNTNYITNPGAGAFFVRINTFDTEVEADQLPTTDDNIIDGGVTVANVMTDSIHIQTKVLETMAFSVGTTNPDTVNQAHGTCDAIAVNAPISLGNSSTEYSLETGQSYDATSYWRLSSNSSGGATVYYSGYTLSNTVGDQIDPINDTGNHITSLGGSAASNPGEEQFGLAYDSTADTFDTVGTNPITSNVTTPLTVDTDYNDGAGTITDGGTASFAFQPASASTPEVIAAGNTDVVECATGKMRYLANIAAATPAGIYTSRVNYLAAPQY